MSDLRGETESQEGGSKPLAKKNAKRKIDWKDPKARLAYMRDWCKAHPGYHAKRHKEWREKNPEKHRERVSRYYQSNREGQRAAHRKWKYGITREEFNQLLLEQGGKCAVCGIQEKLFVDHDHHTMEVRGLLCGNCNTGIGMLGDTIAGVEMALEYMRQWRAKKRKKG